MFPPWEVFNAFFVDQNGMSEAMSLATKITSELSKKELEYFLIELMMVIKKQGIESMCKKCPLVDK